MLEGQTTAIAVAVILVFTFIQWCGVVWGGRTQELTSLLKALAFIALIVACFAVAAPAGAVTAVEAPPAPSGFAIAAAVVIALQGVLYTYDGWTGVIYFSEEVHDPGRDVPRAMIGGVLLVIAIYVLLNAALLWVLPIGAIAASKLPAGLAAETIFGARGDTVIRVLAILSMLSAINAFMMMASRTLFGMSRDGLFHRVASRVNRGGTPAIALWIGAAVAIAFLFIGAFDQVVAVLAFFFVVSYTVSFSAVFILRWREPELERPYRAWGFPFTTGLVLIGSVVFLIGAVLSDRENSKWALGALAVSYPIYWLTQRSVSGTSERED
jgi:APA family basic amino acid/polyamine antiporter